MGFLRDDDYILLMDNPAHFPGWDKIGDRSLSQDDLMKLADTGAKTTFCYLNWDTIEPRMGEYDFTLIEKSIREAENAGLKVLVSIYLVGTRALPSEWYMGNMPEDVNNRPYRALSVWNADFCDYIDGYIRLLGNRYVSDSVNLFNSYSVYGESYFQTPGAVISANKDAIQSFRDFTGDPNAVLLAPEINRYNCEQNTNDWLRKTVVDIMVRRNRTIIEVNGNNEVWHSAHEQLAKAGGGCVRFFRDVLNAYLVEFPGVKINGIQYTYWQHGQKYWDKIDADIDKYGIDMYVGAEYADGIKKYTPKLIPSKNKGFLIAPKGFWTKNETVEPWMLDNIRNSYNAIAAARAK
ncbi:MAG: beta-galactosidase [Candidatus Thorarchaeota archaeon]